jgi:hypothetical protein
MDWTLFWQMAGLMVIATFCIAAIKGTKRG